MQLLEQIIISKADNQTVYLQYEGDNIYSIIKEITDKPTEVTTLTREEIFDISQSIFTNLG